MTMQPVRGTRDFSPEEKILRQGLVETLQKNFELFGFDPIETPALEMYDVMASKYAGGAEILKEIYGLEDQGGRKLALRYDFTVPMCRFIASNPNIAKPFKRYQIGPVWRDGPIKLGRYREFWQCDVDTVGVSSMIADAEILALADSVFKSLKIDFYIKLNNRKLLDGVLDYAKVDAAKRVDAILALDKLDKVGLDGVRKEMAERGIDKNSIKKIEEVFETKGDNAALLKNLNKIITRGEGQEGIQELEQLLSYLELYNVRSVKIEPSLARGLEYYTGPIFEVFLKNSEIKSSVAGGGRYDKIIGAFLGSKEAVPATGISFGFDVICDALKSREDKKTKTSVYIIPIDEKVLPESTRIAAELRAAGVNTAMDLMGKGISKNLDYADRRGIKTVVIVGEKDLKENSVTVRDMKSGEQKKVNRKELRKLLGSPAP